MKRVLLAALLLVPAAVRAQKSCAIDTARYRQVFDVEYSVRAYRGDDTTADRELTQAFGSVLRAHFTPPPSIGELFYPNTFEPNTSRPGRLQIVFGTLRFDLASSGALTSEAWFAPSFDAATDRAIELAIDSAIAAGEIKDVGALIDRGIPQRIRLQFLASNDSNVRAPLLRLRVPILRIDGGGEMMQGGPYPRDLLQHVLSERTEFSIVVDANGHPEAKSVQLIYARTPDVARDAVSIFLSKSFTPFKVGKCAVEFRMPVVFGK